MSPMTAQRATGSVNSDRADGMLLLPCTYMTKAFPEYVIACSTCLRRLRVAGFTMARHVRRCRDLVQRPECRPAPMEMPARESDESCHPWVKRAPQIQDSQLPRSHERCASVHLHAKRMTKATIGIARTGSSRESYRNGEAATRPVGQRCSGVAIAATKSISAIAIANDTAPCFDGRCRVRITNLRPGTENPPIIRMLRHIVRR